MGDGQEQGRQRGVGGLHHPIVFGGWWQREQRRRTKGLDYMEMVVKQLPFLGRPIPLMLLGGRNSHSLVLD